MTNTPNPQAMIEKIKAILDKYCFGNPVTDPIEYSAKACDEIQALITEARIDELDKVQELMKDNVTTIQGIIKFRLKQLKENK